jgi:hypothetical protein
MTTDSPQDPGTRMRDVYAELVRQNRKLPEADANGQPIRQAEHYDHLVDRFTGRQLTVTDVEDLWLAGRDDEIGRAYVDGRLADVLAVEPGLAAMWED